MKNEVQIIRTNRSGKVNHSQTVFARKLGDSWEIKEMSQGWVIEPKKLYHPLSEYFEKPSIFTYIKSMIKIKWWRLRYKIALGKLESDGYGVFLDNERYYFQFRKEDFKKMVLHVKESMKHEGFKVIVSEKK